MERRVGEGSSMHMRYNDNEYLMRSLVMHDNQN